MLHKVPPWVQQFFPTYIWNIPTNKKIVYLTFDDGPIQEITEWVLNVLKNFDIKATFFTVGRNVEENPTIFKKIVDHGHAIGNHTYNHISGWSKSPKYYLEEVKQCSLVIKKYSKRNPILFRPPYGRIKTTQARLLSKEYKLIMWDTLTIDYNSSLSKEKCLKNSIKATQPGSIIVFHDSIKAKKNLTYVLPRYIDHFLSEGYSFKKI